MTQATTQEHTIPRTFENLRGARRFRQRLAKMATNMATENTENRGITKAGKVANLSPPAHWIRRRSASVAWRADGRTGGRMHPQSAIPYRDVAGWRTDFFACPICRSASSLRTESNTANAMQRGGVTLAVSVH